MSDIGYRILTWAFIAGPFVVALIWFIISRNHVKKAKYEQKQPGCFAMSSQIFSVVFLILAICWGIFMWLLDAIMSSM